MAISKAPRNWNIVLSKIKFKWIKFILPEGQIGRLRPYMASIAKNLWGIDLLQQWETDWHSFNFRDIHKMGDVPGKGIEML